MTLLFRITSKLPRFVPSKLILNGVLIFSAKVLYEIRGNYKKLEEEMIRALELSDSQKECSISTLSNSLNSYTRLTGELTDIEDSKNYSIGFMRKHCVPMGSASITHGAVLLIDDENQTYWQLGRQSDFFKHTAKGSFFQRKFSDLVRTQMHNEARFQFFEESRVETFKTDTKILGSEVKEALKYTNGLLCLNKLYIPHWSNCYSAAIVLMLEMYNRTQAHQALKPNKDSKLKCLLFNAARDNCGLGVANNETVLREFRMVGIKRLSKIN